LTLVVSSSDGGKAAPQTMKPCFDVFRSDVSSHSLVRIASSTTRWTAIPLLPLPHSVNKNNFSPSSSPTSTLSDLVDTEEVMAAAAQRAFELEVVHLRRDLRPADQQDLYASNSTLGTANIQESTPSTHRHVCPRCQKRFNRPSSLLAHGRAHTGFCCLT
jgi:hypothetical protein